LTAYLSAHIIDESSIADDITSEGNLEYSAVILAVLLWTAYLVAIGERTEGSQETDESPFPKQSKCGLCIEIFPL